MIKYIDAEQFKRDNERLLHCDFPYLAEETLEELIDNAPAADIPQWIPVTERFPEEQETYLVTVNDGGIRVAIAQWWYGYLDHAGGFFACDDCYAEDIVAWMPLPDPYKGGEGKC